MGNEASKPGAKPPPPPQQQQQQQRKQRKQQQIRAEEPDVGQTQFRQSYVERRQKLQLSNVVIKQERTGDGPKPLSNLVIKQGRDEVGTKPPEQQEKGRGTVQVKDNPPPADSKLPPTPSSVSAKKKALPHPVSAPKKKHSKLPPTPSTVSAKKALPDPMSAVGTGKSDNPYVVVDSGVQDRAAHAQPPSGNAFTFGFENGMGFRDIGKSDGDVKRLINQGYKRKKTLYSMEAAQEWLDGNEEEEPKRAKTSASPVKRRPTSSGSLTLWESWVGDFSKVVTRGKNVGKVKTKQGQYPQYSVQRIMEDYTKMLTFFVSPTHPNFEPQLLRFIAIQMPPGVKHLVVLCGEEAAASSAIRELVPRIPKTKEDGVEKISNLSWMHIKEPPISDVQDALNERADNAAGVFVLYSLKPRVGHPLSDKDITHRYVVEDTWEAMEPRLSS